WKWRSEAAIMQSDIAHIISQGYHLCVYHGSQSDVVVDINIPVTGWRTIGSSGYTIGTNSSSLSYQTRGLDRMTIKSGTTKRSSVVLLGKGVDLPLTDPIPHVRDPVKVQLKKDGDPLCLESEFGTADQSRNDGRTFRAKR